MLGLCHPFDYYAAPFSDVGEQDLKHCFCPTALPGWLEAEGACRKPVLWKSKVFASEELSEPR